MAGASASGDETAPSARGQGVDRRQFVRAMAGETVNSAGRLAGMSGMVAGALTAAARAAGDGFAALGGAPQGAAAPAARVRHPTPSRAVPPPMSASPIADADRLVLEDQSLGLLATNQTNTAPSMGVVRYTFDGRAFRIPGRSATARTSNLQRDPHASLTVIDPATGEALLAAGRAAIVYGEAGRDGVAEVMAACGVEVSEGWEAPDNRGDPVLVVLEVQRVIRRGPDERP